MTRHHIAHRLHRTVDELASPAEAATTPHAHFAVVAFVAAWVGVGLMQAWVLARRGHDARVMSAVGAGLGPLMTIVTLEATRNREPMARPVVVDAGVAGPGELNVLVVLEGAADAARELTATIDAVRAELGRLTIAKVVPFEAVEHVGDGAILDADIAVLRDAAAAVPGVDPELVLLPGHRSTAPRRFAHRRGIDLVLHAHDGPT